MDSIIKYFFVIVIVAFMVILNGFVGKSLWEWFLVPFGLVSITLAHAIGIGLVVSAFSHHSGCKVSEEPKDVLMMITRPFVLYGVGFGIHYYFM